MVVEPRTRNHRRRDFHPDVFFMPQPTVDTTQTPSTGDILLKQTDSLRTHTSGTPRHDSKKNILRNFSVNTHPHAPQPQLTYEFPVKNFDKSPSQSNLNTQSPPTVRRTLK